MNIGLDEIVGVFIGTDEIIEGYVGTDLVWSSSFEGIQVKPNSITFTPYVSSVTVKVKSDNSWTASSIPAWLSVVPATGNAGETVVTITNLSQTTDTSTTIGFDTVDASASLAVAYDSATYQVIDGVRSSSAPYWDLYNHLNTGIYVTDDTDTRIRIKYYGGGTFSDRIVGFDSIETGGGDDVDFRYFPEMADAANGRINGLYGWYNTDQYYDITFSNLKVYDNINNVMVADIGTYYGISNSTTIRIDMSVNWIKEVVIQRWYNSTWNTIADFKAAKVGNDYGLFDTNNNTFLTKSDLIGITTPPSA